jgi:hypothetical protein
VLAAALGLPSTFSTTDRRLIPAELQGEAALQALKNLTSEQRALLEDREKQRLREEPLDRSSLENLAQLAAIAGEEKRAESFIVAAAARSLRSTGIQLAAVNLMIRDGDYGSAWRHADGLLRAKPDLAQQIFQAMAPHFSNSRALETLINQIKLDPPWRAALVRFVIQSSAPADGGYAFLSQMRKQGAGPHREELSAYFAHAEKTNNHTQAFFVFLDFLGEDELRRAQNIFDGSFVSDAGNRMYDWNVLANRNARIEVDTKPGSSSDRALRIDVFGNERRFRHVWQYLRLLPGAYSFKGEFKAENVKTDSGLRWRLHCLGGSLVGQSNVIAQSAPWSSFSFPVQVPEQGCETQLLRLESASSQDTGLSGQFYFDNFSIVDAAAANVP